MSSTYFRIRVVPHQWRDSSEVAYRVQYKLHPLQLWWKNIKTVNLNNQFVIRQYWLIKSANDFAATIKSRADLEKVLRDAEQFRITPYYSGSN